MTAGIVMLLAGMFAGAVGMAWVVGWQLVDADWKLRIAQAIREQAGEMLHEAELAAVLHEPTTALPVVVRTPIRVRLGAALLDVRDWAQLTFAPAADPEWAAGELRLVASNPGLPDRWLDRSAWPTRRRVQRRRRIRPTPLLFDRLPVDPTRQYRVKVMA